MKHCITALLTGLAAFAASAHEGHGMIGTSHWHASDAWGFALVGAAALAMLVWGRRK